MKKSWKHLISEDEFWEIIDNSLVGAKYLAETQYQQLEQILKTKSLEELIGICYHSIELYRKAYTPELWAAPFIAMGGCGDDSFHYFRCWLVNRGKYVYYNALKDPDSLVSEFEHYEYRNDIQADLLKLYVNDVYKGISGGNTDLDDVIESEYEEQLNTKGEMELSELIEFDWDGNDEKRLKNICPRIFAKYWNNPLQDKYRLIN